MSETPESISEERRAQLVAAAVALRTWVNEQRDAWPERPLAGPSFNSGTARPSIESIRPQASPESKSSKRKAKSAPARSTEKNEAPTRPSPIPSISARTSDEAPAPIEAPVPLIQDEEESDSGSSSWIARAVLSAAAVAIVTAMGYVGWSKRADWLTKAEPAPKMGTAVLESVPPGSDVFIDGTPAGKAPVTKELEAGRHMVEFRRRSSSRKLQVQVVAGRQTIERLDWTAKRKGSLEILTEPDGASVSVDGTPRGVTPLTIDDLAVGVHAVVLESSSGSIKRSVTISPDGVSQITEAIYSGWLHVSSPIEVQLAEGARSLVLDERNQVLLPPGLHDLQFENRALAYKERRKVEIKPGQIAEVSIVPPSSQLNVIASLPAEVIIDGKRVGEAPLSGFPIDIGTRSIVVKSITGPERRFTVTATAKPITLDVDFSKP